MRFYNSRSLILAAVAASLLFQSSSLQAQQGTILPGNPDIINHEVISSSTGLKRTVRVRLPRGYHGHSRRHPLLIVMDGDDYFAYLSGLAELLSQAGAIPRLIVVAVYSPDRWHDFTPTRGGIPGGRQVPSSGGGPTFLDFLTNDVLPMLDATYRTQPFRILAGHSLSGLFGVYAFATGKGPFHACLTTSPSLWWDKGKVVERFIAKPAPESAGAAARFLYVAVGGEGETIEKPWAELRDGLKSRPSQSLRCRFRLFPGKKHQVMPVWGFADGLEFIFSSWTPPSDLTRSGLAGVRDFFAGVSRLYGFKVDPPEMMLNRLGYDELHRGNPHAALAAFRLNASLYPESANVHDSLGEALAAAGLQHEALVEYRLAYGIAPRLRGLKERIQKLESLIRKARG